MQHAAAAAAAALPHHSAKHLPVNVVPLHWRAGSVPDAAQDAATARAARTTDLLFRHHARRPGAEPVQQGYRHDGFRSAGDPARLECLLFRGIVFVPVVGYLFVVFLLLVFLVTLRY